MRGMKTLLEKIDKNQIDEQILAKAGEILKQGGLVAFPTETVYGLGANAGALSGLPQALQLVFGESGIVPACFVAILMNVLLPKEKEA